MTAVLHGQASKQTRVSRSWVERVLRVGTAAEFVGDILLDHDLRVRRHARSVPRDIVLKALVANTKLGETCGKLTGRDGVAYYWHVVGEEDR